MLNSMSKNTLWLIRTSLIALVLAAYITWTSLNKEAVLAGCGEGSGCEAVLQTKFSSWFGLPVGFGALAVYEGIFVLTFFIASDKQKPWILLVFLSVLASLSGLWFVGLQLFLIKAYCKYFYRNSYLRTFDYIFCFEKSAGTKGRKARED